LALQASSAETRVHAAVGEPERSLSAKEGASGMIAFGGRTIMALSGTLTIAAASEARDLANDRH